MNPNTGHLISLLPLIELPTDYVKVPKDLELPAILKLNGKQEAMVSLTSGGKLSRWASKIRMEKKKKKIAAKSRRINRSKK